MRAPVCGVVQMQDRIRKYVEDKAEAKFERVEKRKSLKAKPDPKKKTVVTTKEELDALPDRIRSRILQVIGSTGKTIAEASYVPPARPCIGSCNAAGQNAEAATPCPSAPFAVLPAQHRATVLQLRACAGAAGQTGDDCLCVPSGACRVGVRQAASQACRFVE